jgi:hypothetical protein
VLGVHNFARQQKRKILYRTLVVVGVSRTLNLLEVWNRAGQSVGRNVWNYELYMKSDVFIVP